MHDQPLSLEQEAQALASLDPLADLGTQLRRQGGQIGMDQAERWIAISDAGSGVEDFPRSKGL